MKWTRFDFLSAVLLAFVFCLIVSCEEDEELGIQIDAELGALPETPFAPVDNPITEEKIELGRLLFWDPMLSANGDVACASCHHPEHDYAENLDISRGVGAQGLGSFRTGGSIVKRNSPTIINTAYNGIDASLSYDPSNTVMFWDNRATSLEDQALDPIRSMEEMRGTQIPADAILDTVVNRLNNNSEYRDLFNVAFGVDSIRENHMAMAIATFERSIIAPNSRFDQFSRGDETALTVQEIQGMEVFLNNGCGNCHNGPMFSDWQLHNLGVEPNDRLSVPDNGVNGQFRTPTLRNLRNTGPYFHNGTSATLEDAINFYDDDPEIELEAQGVNVDGGEVQLIQAFILSLQDDNFDRSIPERVPSGLNPGGNIN